MPRPYPRLSGVRTGPLSERMIAFVERYCPPHIRDQIYVTSAYRPAESGSHHSGLIYAGSPTAATDHGAYDDPEANSKDQNDMRAFSLWWYENFWDLLIELIHTHPGDSLETYVKNQAKVGPYAAQDHINHVHVATSANLMDKIEARARARWGDGNASQPSEPIAYDGAFPLPSGHYFGDINGPAESHGGFHANERPAIKHIQARLQNLGFAPQATSWVDGIYGPETVEAVKAFQRARGLAVDGKVGPQTWDRLMDGKDPGQAPPATAGAIFGCDLYDFDADRGMTDNHVRGFVTSGGLKFMNAKIVETAPSGQWVHHDAMRMLRAAVDAGLTFPAGFIVPRTGLPVEQQVAELLAHADVGIPFWRTHPGFFWQVDAERWTDKQGKVYDHPPIEMCVEMVKHLMIVTQKPAILYCNPTQYPAGVPAYPGRSLWRPNYNGSGASRDYRDMYLGDSAPGWGPYPDGAVAVLNQFCSDGKVNGYGPVVMSAFRGNEGDFRAMLAATLAPYGTHPDPPSPPPQQQPDLSAIVAELAEVKAAISALSANIDALRTELPDNSAVLTGLSAVLGEVKKVSEGSLKFQ